MRQPTIVKESMPMVWSREITLSLIELYRTNHLLIGKKFKSVKAMFEFIAQELNDTLKLSLTWIQVSNKMKSLERSYKDTVDNNNATGRRRKDFEYETQMSEFMAKKRNVNPIILVSESTESELTQVTKKNDPTSEVHEDLFVEMGESVLLSTPAVSNHRPKRPKPQTRVDVLDKLRKDRQKHMEVKEKIWREKLLEDKRMADAIENRNRLEEKKLELLARLIQKLDG